jgi:hypothetical protein
MDETNLSRLEQLLEDNLELAEENNKILHSMQRTMRWSFWGKLLLWIIVLVLPFFVLGPLVHSLLPISNGGTGSKTLFGLPSGDEIQNLLKAYHESTTSSQGQ